MPETGHTALLPADQQVVTVPMDNGWSKGIQVGKLEEDDTRPVVVDMHPVADPVLLWARKRNRREVSILPLQRNKILTDSRTAQIIEQARLAAVEKSSQVTLGSIFVDLERNFRESEKSKRVEFYIHDEGWKNKLICGDSLKDYRLSAGSPSGQGGLNEQLGVTKYSLDRRFRHKILVWLGLSTRAMEIKSSCKGSKVRHMGEGYHFETPQDRSHLLS